MDEKKKWTVKDAITTVLLSAVLIVIQGLRALRGNRQPLPQSRRLARIV